MPSQVLPFSNPIHTFIYYSHAAGTPFATHSLTSLDTLWRLSVFSFIHTPFVCSLVLYFELIAPQDDLLLQFPHSWQYSCIGFVHMITFTTSIDNDPNEIMLELGYDPTLKRGKVQRRAISSITDQKSVSSSLHNM
jgi:hypothetical protein